jgi:hypothetical protein
MAQSAAAPFVKFDVFVKAVATADAATYLRASQSKVVSAAAFEEMRQHVLALYAGVQVAHSFVYNEQYVDCVPVLQQPGARRLGLRELPPPPPALPAGMTAAPSIATPFASGRIDSFGNQLLCEDGTIPMRRITLDELSKFPTLNDYFGKAPGGDYPAPSIDAAGYKHRSLSIGPKPNIGAASQFELWYPFVDTSKGEYHSLSQLWIEGFGGAAILQTAEAGWQVAPSHYNTNAAVPFIYYTNQNYAPGSGCYNLECGGFVQTSNALVLGVPNWPGPSQPGGQQVVFSLQYQAIVFDDGTLFGWELYYNCTPQTLYTCAIGYYPVSVYGTGQLSMGSNDLQFGGETYTSTHTLFGQMGSGAFPNAGPGYAAYQSNVYYVEWHLYRDGQHHPLAVSANLGYDDFPQTTACYGELCTANSCNFFYFGGPGGANCPGS